MAEPVEVVAVVQAQAEQVPEPPALPPATAEQVQAADAVFMQDPEAATVAGLIGLWGGARLLHDLALDHLPRDEDEEKRKRATHPSDPQGRSQL